MNTLSTSDPPGLARRPRAWGRRLQQIRHLVQLGFALFIAALVVRHEFLPEGEAASAESYCPFGGLETLYRWASSGGKFIEHSHASNFVLFIAILLTAVVARGFFCGWVCPFGSIQSVIALVSRTLQRHIPALRTWSRATQHRLAWLAALDRPLRYARYAVLAWVLIGTAYYGRMVFRDVDPWSALLEIATLQVTLAFGVLVAVLLLSFVVERPFCRYACPLGATIGLVGKLSPIAIERKGDSCVGCNLCSTACPVGIPVERLSRVTDSNCLMCFECLGSCPSESGLNVTLTLPGVPTRPRVAGAVSPDPDRDSTVAA